MTWSKQLNQLRKIESMNKVFQINLAGFPFTIDENAFGVLLDYLDSLQSYFKNSEGKDEIIYDIESRIAELFQENLTNKSIIDLRDVNAAIERMGTIEDFQDESIDIGHEDEAKNSYKTGKKLFRDEENGQVAGICAGLAAYFGIQDPVWVRILFILLFFSGGISIVLYLVLWAIIPQAKTSADRLAMKGEKINISNIAKDVEDSMENFAHKMSEFGESFKSKKKRRRDKRDQDNIIKKGFFIITSIFSGLFRIILKILKPIFYILCVIALFGAVVAWIALIFGLYKILPFSSFIVAGPTAISYMVNGLIFLSLGIPLTLIIAGLLKWVFKTSFPRRIRNGLWGAWGIGLLMLFSISIWTVREFKTSATITETLDMTKVSSDVLTINWETPTDYHFNLNQFGPIHINNDQIYTDDLDLSIKPTTKPNFEATIIKSARGMTYEQAQSLANNTEISSSVGTMGMDVKNKIQISRPHKWRDQEAKLEIKIPIGKFIKLNGKNYINSSMIDQDQIHPKKFGGYTWQMTKNGLICPEYIEENAYQEERDFRIIQTFND